MRRNSGSRPPDITYLTEIVRKVGYQPSIEIGLVLEPEDGGTGFYDLDDADLIVFVELVPSGRQMPCRVMAPAGGADQGVWSIPTPGTEVVVGIPSGDQGEGGVILGCLSTGHIPSGVSTGNVVVRAPDGGSAFLGGTDGAQATFLADNFLQAFDILIAAIGSTMESVPAVGSAMHSAITAAKTQFDQAVAQNGKTTIAKVK